MSGEAISQDDLAYARTLQQEALTGAAARLERMTARDATGGRTETWAPDVGHQAVPCRVGNLSPDAIAQHADRLQGNDGAILTLPWGTPCAYRDHWVVAGDRTYEVVAPNYGGSVGTALRAVVKAID